MRSPGGFESHPRFPLCSGEESHAVAARSGAARPRRRSGGAGFLFGHGRCSGHVAYTHTEIARHFFRRHLRRCPQSRPGSCRKSDILTRFLQSVCPIQYTENFKIKTCSPLPSKRRTRRECLANRVVHAVANNFHGYPGPGHYRDRARQSRKAGDCVRHSKDRHDTAGGNLVHRPESIVSRAKRHGYVVRH